MNPIKIVPYDERWQVLFEQEQEWLRNILPYGLPVSIEHFGSTAVPGAEAQAVIDIIIGVHALESAHKARGLIESFGYRTIDRPDADYLYFAKDEDGARTHDLYIAALDSALWDQMLVRDYLRVNGAEATRYGALKRALAAQHGADREAYRSAKTPFLEELLAKAKQAARAASPDWD